MELIPIKVVKQCLKLFLFWFGDKNPLLYRPLSLTSFINCSNCVVHIVVHLALLPVWLLSTKLDYILKYISVYFQRNFFSFLCFFPFLCLYCFLNLFSSFPVLLFVSFCCFLSWSLISLFHLGWNWSTYNSLDLELIKLTTHWADRSVRGRPTISILVRRPKWI